MADKGLQDETDKVGAFSDGHYDSTCMRRSRCNGALMSALWTALALGALGGSRARL